MAWRNSTKPTPANIRRRITAAIEALEGAQNLAANHGHLPRVLRNELRYAEEWARSARARAERRR